MIRLIIRLPPHHAQLQVLLVISLVILSKSLFYDVVLKVEEYPVLERYGSHLVKQTPQRRLRLQLADLRPLLDQEEPYRPEV